MNEEVELQKCISELENSFNKAMEFLRTCSGNNSIFEIRKYLVEATNALNALSQFRGEKKNLSLNVSHQEDVCIDEYSDNDLHQSEDDWGGDNDDFGDMIKACEEAEQSLNGIDDASDNEKDLESEPQLEEPEKEENKLPSVSESFDCEPPTEEHLRVLKQNFGHASFRPIQWKILRAILEEKRDVSAVMATGYGKSLCYQYPAVYLSKPVVVISPLISLMEDQVMSLNVANIPACYLGSAQSEMAKVQREILMGKYKVVYLTPEYIMGTGASLIKELYKKIGISLFAIDESHCVSQWGHDFRSNYRDLGKVRTNYNNVPFIAVTATATPPVQRDICDSLRLKNPLRVVSSFDRPNLFLEVCMKSPSFENDILRIMTKTNGKLGFSGSTIIYCPTISTTDTVHEKLLSMNIPCQKYHSKVREEQKKIAHRDFVYDKVEVIVATVAFGMGIDKPDVRRIIHYGAPKDIESYYQEIGRAGRDGLPSICQVLYANADFITSKFFLKECKKEIYDHKSDMIAKMQQYLNSTQCRRQLLLSHFDGPDPKTYKLSDKCCDNCKKKLKRSRLSNVNGVSQEDQEGKKDFSVEAKLLFEAIIDTSGMYGLTVPVYIVRGSANQRISDSMKKSRSYGKGKHRSEQWWKALGRLLLCEKYLQEQKPNTFGSKQRFSGATINVTPRAKQWLEKVNKSTNENVPLILEMNTEMTNLEEAQDIVTAKLTAIAAAKATYSPISTSSKRVPVSPDNLQELPKQVEEEVELDPVEEELKAALYKELMSLRNSLADTDGIAPYMVFSNKNLLDIAIHRPSSLQSMSQIEGITSARISKFGDPMIKLVTEFCKDNNLKEDVFTKNEKSKDSGVNKSDHHLIYQLNSTAQMTYALYEVEGKDIEQVQKERQLALSTIYAHLAEAIKIGLPVRLKDTGVTQEMIDIVKKIITSPPINFDISRLSPIKQLCPDYIEFNHLKIILAVFQSNINLMKSEKEETTEGSSKDLVNQNNKETQNHSPPVKDTNMISDLKRKEAPHVEPTTMKKIKSNKLFKL